MPTPTTIIVDQGDAQTAQINTAFGGQIFCRLFDEFGNWMVGAAVEFAPPPGASAPSAQFAGSFGPYFPYATTTAGDGRAHSLAFTANGLAGAWAGTVYSVAVPSVVATFNMTNSLNPPTPTLTTLSFISGGTQMAARNTNYAAVTVRGYDQYGAAIAGVVVTMTVAAGHGAFPGGGLSNNATTNSSGDATFTAFAANATLGAFNPSIGDGIIVPIQAAFTTIDPTVVTSLSAYSGNNQSAAPSFPYALPLVIRAANALNNPVAGASIVVTAPGSGASLVWDSPATNPVTVISDVNGLATTPSFAANATAGTFYVPATLGGAQTAYFQLTNGGSPPADSSALILCEV